MERSPTAADLTRFDWHRDTIVGSLYSYRSLLLALVLRAVRARYRGSVLGYLWTLVSPLAMMGIYTLVFSVYLRVDLPAYPAFLFAGLIPWLWFASSLQEGSVAIVYGANLITRSCFPPELMPAVAVLSNGVNFVLALPVLLLFVFVFGRPLTPALAALPLLAALQLLLTLGVVVVLSTWNVYYRDVQHIVPSLIQLLFFATPILYPPSLVPARLGWVLGLNPWARLAAGYQRVLYQGGWPSGEDLAVLLAVGVALHAASELVFRGYRDRLVEEL